MPSLCGPTLGHICPEDLLYHAMSTFGLPVTLRMKCCREGQPSTHNTHERTPERSCEPWIPVAHDGRWHAEIANDAIEKEARCLPRTMTLVTHSARCESYQLREPVDTGENRCIPPTGWKPSDEVHGPRLETRSRNLKWLEFPLLGLR